jgi:putative ABC transport system permease protein
MRRLRGVRLIPRVAASARSIERAVDDEMRFHLQMRVDDLMRQGIPRDEAETQAQREFGDVASARAQLADIDRRAARRAGWREAVSSLVHDVRISLRGLEARPGFTATILLTLALGIGANAAIFSVVNAVLLKPLPFAAPARLVHLWETYDGVIDSRSEASYPDYLDWRVRTHTLADAAGYQTRGALLGDEHPTSVGAGTVTANFFDVLGVRPALGRTFVAGEDAVGAPNVVVLTDELWERQFGRDSRAVGATITVEGRPATVIGVLPRGFRFGGRAGKAELWMPIVQDQSLRDSRGSHWINVVGRLRDGASVSSASTDLAAIMRELASEYPRTNAGRSGSVVPLRDELVGSVRPLLLVLYGAVAAVLLVACANVANLLLMRGTDREREMAVRVALGAGRARLVRQLLTESLLLALGGGALALVFAHFGIRAIVHAIPSRTLDALPAVADAAIDARVATYAMLVSVFSGIVFGLAPALRATGASIYDLLKQGARDSVARGRLRDGLVIAEIALTVVLVSGATLFARSLGKLLSIDLGFRGTHVTTAGVLLSTSRADDGSRSVQVFDRLVASVRAIPGVESVGLVSRLPLNGGETWSFAIAGRPPAEPGHEPTGSIRWTGGDYFQTMGIAVKRGRAFSAADGADAPKVVIINDAFVRRYFPSADPIGQHIVRRSDSLTVVGVVDDVPIARLEDKTVPTWYVPMAQASQGFMRIAIRAARPNADLLRGLSVALGRIDPRAAVVDPATMDDLLTRSSSVFTRRFPLLLVGVFAATALVLALIGIYGVVSYSVGQRRRELGIRLALGAEPRSVIALFLRHAARMAAVGTTVGVVGALLATRFVAGMLYGVEPSDPATYLATAGLLSVAALSATFIPALRATRVDPTITLRAE